MKNTLRLLGCALFLCATAFAQKAPIKFGDIPMEDMKMTVYPLDSGAVAVVLTDFGTSTLEYNQTAGGFQLRFDRIRRIKILKREGLSYAEFMIPLWAESSGANQEKLSSIKAATYNLENGKIVDTNAKKDAFFREKYDNNLTYYKGTWPNVREGSIIELSYSVLSEFMFNFQDWEFQSTIPVRWSEYRAKIPEYYNYQKYMQGYVSLVVNESTPRNGQIVFHETRTTNGGTVDYREDNFRWAAQNVPAFKSEPYITSVNDYISKMNFELAFTKSTTGAITNYMGTWEDINTSYNGSVRSKINAAMGLKDDVQKAIAGATTEEEKVAMIFDFVKRSVLWDGTDGKYPDKDPWNTLEAKKGSSAEINLLLACLLDKIKIPVNPVLLSTRSHGFVRESFPLISQFNYVACQAQVGTKTILLDATDRMLPIGTLPERCLNGSGLAVTPSGPKWVSLQPTVKSRTLYDANFILADNGELKGTLKVDKSGYHSAKARRQYLVKGEGEYVKDFAKDHTWTYSNSKFENADDISLPFKETHQAITSEVATANPGTIYFNPIFIGREEENPFKSETREYPVDFGNQFEQVYVAKITIPEGYVVEELPPAKLITLPENAARYLYSTTQQGNTINITSGLYINRSLFAQDIYPNLREFFNQMIAKQAEQVVLKKK